MSEGTIKTQSSLSAAVDRLSTNTPRWTNERLIDEGLDLIRDYCWAGSSALYGTRGGSAELIRVRPSTHPLEEPATISDTWFPWGLAAMNPERFIFVEQAEQLPALPCGSATLGDLGIRSCLHLPILERRRPVGFLQVFWPEPRLVWDDDIGQILRSLGRFLLSMAVTERQAP
ncbi:MAG: GAF domain-containing protein [Microthrixaceae bacterium]|jgi:hypothetical protein